MRYYSTRDHAKQHGFTLREAAFIGLAPDGGLFMPEYIPQADLGKIEAFADESYASMASYIAGLFFGEDIGADELDAMVRRIYDFPCPLNCLDSRKWVLELTQGPTIAFKDFGARFMGGMLGLLRPDEGDLTVLTATSGDTGSAVAAGFYGVTGVRVAVLYPQGKVSDLQESQMTTLGGNILPVCVEGDFDDCQKLVKDVFNDKAYRATHNITSANSINILRWIPQSFYYFYAWHLWKKATGRETPDFVVPSGNYGNITAGMLAMRMGLPVRNFIAASNANDVIPEFLRTSVYCPRKSVRTIANAMDVGAPSNYERMMWLFGGDFSALKNVTSGFSSDDAAIREGIRDMYLRYAYTADPHTASGYNAAVSYDADGILLSTAHPAKFKDVVAAATGADVRIPPQLQAAMSREKKFTVLRAGNDMPGRLYGLLDEMQKPHYSTL